jgi:hypothetical protein
MKIIITTSSTQPNTKPVQKTTTQSTTSGNNSTNLNLKGVKAVNVPVKKELSPEQIKADQEMVHNMNTVLQIGTAFIPVVGPFISAAIGLADAHLYYKEGDNQAAGLTAAFSMLPFVGSVVSKIPGVEQLGAKGMAALSSKLSKGQKLTQLETEIVNSINKIKKFIKSELTKASSRISPVIKEIQSLKPSYIERFGRDKYDELLRDYISGVSDKNYFLQSLNSAKNALPDLANFVTKFGIKFSKNEIDQIQKVVDSIFDSNDVIDIVKLETKNGPRTIKVKKVDGDWVAKNRPDLTNSAGWANQADDLVVINRGATQYMTPKSVEDLLMHEFGHIKDPSLVKSPVYLNLYRDKANQGIASLKKAADWEKTDWDALGLSKPVDDIADLKKHGTKNYILNPNEIIANNTMVLQSLASETKLWTKYLPKKDILKGLDDIISYAKGNTNAWSREAKKLLGYDYPYIEGHLETLVSKPSEYKKLLVKLAQQAEYLKSQIKLAM